MKEYTDLTRAELIARLRALESPDARGGPGLSETTKSSPKGPGTLSDTEERLRAILQTAVEGIITIDERGIVESMNPAAEKTFGFKAEEVIGKNVSVLMPSPYREEHDAHLGHYLRSGHAKIIGIGREVVGQRKDGTVFPMDLAVSEVRLADRRLFTGFVRDISERKKSEEQVHLVRSVVEQGFSAVLIISAEWPDPKVIYINPAFAQATGYAAEKVIGQPLSSLESLSHVYQRLRAGLPGDAPFLDEISTYQTLKGERWGEWRVGPVKDKTGRNSHWLIIFRDITERKRLEREILEISDQERRRIGQDLHDGLCQHLAGIELMSQVLQQKLATKSKAEAARAGEIARHVREAIGQTRSLARGLSPVTLESEGLASALRELAANTEKMFGIMCRVECLQTVPSATAATGMHLYRIAQEAVSNAIKHGKATEVVIRLQSASERLVLNIMDNGSGFPKVMPRNDGMGLRIMRYRAGMIGGLLSIEQNHAGGTVVSCSVPVRVTPVLPASVA
jgi:PAS domain S-box-containing protein